VGELRPRRVYMLIFLLCFLDCLTTYFLLIKFNDVELEFNPLLRVLLRYSYYYVFAYFFFESAYFTLAYKLIERVRARAGMRIKLEYSVFLPLLLAVISNTIGLLAPASYK
jgi:hypothetical protein